MPEISIRAATPGDRTAVLSLLDASGLSSEGVHPELAGFAVAEEGARVVGVAGLELYGRQGLLRSVAVASDRRGHGLGALLTGAIVAGARANEVDGLYALTTTAEGYFPKLGFERIERSAVPPEIRESAEYRTVCPDTAAVLRLPLT